MILSRKHRQTRSQVKPGRGFLCSAGVISVLLLNLPHLSAADTKDYQGRADHDLPFEQIIRGDKVSKKEMTLRTKADHFERIIRERHVKHGFVRELKLDVQGEPEKGGFLHHDDNDGLWTSLYVAAMSFKYAVEKDTETRKWAKESFNALEWLVDITGVPGFPARSIVEAGEPARFKYDGEWHPDSSGHWEWKGDTSSDELDGHFFAYSIYYDLVADKMDKRWIRSLVSKVMDHIIGNDWYLVDVDGKPTRWGVWNPKQLNHNKPVHGVKDEDWIVEHGLNSLEILSHLKVAYHITGNRKYQDRYLKLIKKHGYAENTVEQKITVPYRIHHGDDQLAFLAYYPLLKYETDPKLLEIYRKSLQRTWDFERPERNPWWNITYCAYMPGDCAVMDSVRTLREIPWEQINWRKENSKRKDVEKDPGYRVAGKEQSKEVLPYSDFVLQRWNGNPYLLDTGGAGDIEGDGVVFLLPYWMGRYHRFIQ